MENIQPASNQQLDEELTLKELILSIQKYLYEIWKNKWLIAVFCLPFLIWKGYEYFKSHITYPAKITFMIDDGSSGGLNIGGLLSTLGGGKEDANYAKIVALSKSMRIVREVMLTKVVIEGVNDFIGNHLIRLEKINEESWSKIKPSSELPTLNGFLFTRDSFEKFSRLEYSAMKYMQSVLNGNEERSGIFTANYDEDSGIITFNVACRTEEMSIVLLNTFYEKLGAFYIEKEIGKNISTYNVVKQKADSIRQILNALEVRQAKFEDASHSVLLNADKVPAQRYARDRQLLTLMYGESAKNLEMADFALKSSAPYIQLIDNAVPPLKSKRLSRFKLLLTALSLGVVCGIVFVIARRVFLDNYDSKAVN